MGDLLSSASLLVGVAGLIYSVWYAEIQAALKLDVPPYGRDPLIDQVRVAIRHRAAPITAVVVSLTLALTPPAWEVLSDAARAIQSGNARYDAVAACFVVVFAALVVLSTACSRDLLTLIAVMRRLKTPID